jgi:hypothetical protein
VQRISNGGYADGKFVDKGMSSSDLHQYKSFLMRGLINDEENFRITPSDEIYADFPTQDTPDSFTLGAF